MTDTRNLTDIVELLTKAAKDAFERGYRSGYADGTEDTRRRIIQAVSSEPPRITGRAAAIEVVPVDPNPAHTLPETGDNSPRRVERGTVRRVLQEVMSEDVGRTMADLGDMAGKIDSRISATSIPNELRRNEGTFYRREGALWFLIGSAEKETAGLAANEHPAALITNNHGGAS